MRPRTHHFNGHGLGAGLPVGGGGGGGVPTSPHRRRALFVAAAAAALLSHVLPLAWRAVPPCAALPLFFLPCEPLVLIDGGILGSTAAGPAALGTLLLRATRRCAAAGLVSPCFADALAATTEAICRAIGPASTPNDVEQSLPRDEDPAVAATPSVDSVSLHPRSSFSSSSTASLSPRDADAGVVDASSSSSSTLENALDVGAGADGMWEVSDAAAPAALEVVPEHVDSGAPSPRAGSVDLPAPSAPLCSSLDNFVHGQALSLMYPFLAEAWMWLARAADGRINQCHLFSGPSQVFGDSAAAAATQAADGARSPRSPDTDGGAFFPGSHGRAHRPGSVSSALGMRSRSAGSLGFEGARGNTGATAVAAALRRFLPYAPVMSSFVVATADASQGLLLATAANAEARSDRSTTQFALHRACVFLCLLVAMETTKENVVGSNASGLASGVGSPRHVDSGLAARGIAAAATPDVPLPNESPAVAAGAALLALGASLVERRSVAAETTEFECDRAAAGLVVSALAWAAQQSPALLQASLVFASRAASACVPAPIAAFADYATRCAAGSLSVVSQGERADALALLAALCVPASSHSSGAAPRQCSDPTAPRTSSDPCALGSSVDWDALLAAALPHLASPASAGGHLQVPLPAVRRTRIAVLFLCSAAVSVATERDSQRTANDVVRNNSCGVNATPIAAHAEAVATRCADAGAVHAALAFLETPASDDAELPQLAGVASDGWGGVPRQSTAAPSVVGSASAVPGGVATRETFVALLHTGASAEADLEWARCLVLLSGLAALAPRATERAATAAGIDVARAAMSCARRAGCLSLRRLSRALAVRTMRQRKDYAVPDAVMASPGETSGLGSVAALSKRASLAA